MNASQARTKVLIFSGPHRIEGDIAHFPDARLTDYMNEANPFLAVTAVVVKDIQGKQILSAPFLNVRRESVDIIVPVEGAMID